jgi:DNA polymerase-3 subunit gamma/tau
MVFEDVVGQGHITTTLRNAIASNRLSHSYLFSGPRGCGKTTTARLLAKAINCLSPKDFNPDNECDICKEITQGRSIDVQEIDGASNRGVDEVRTLRESVKYAPVRSKYKVYIIDEVHMLTKEAFSALLKTLEEPPPHILFVFATTEVHKVPPTILSRCQRFDFRRISIEEIIGRLRLIAGHEKITIDDDALLIVAKKGDGSLRDAQSIFDQMVSFCGTTINAQTVIEALNIVDEELYFRVTDLIRTRDTKGGLDLVDEIMGRGYDIREFLGGLSEHFRNMLVVLSTNATQLVETSEAFKKRYLEDAKHFTQNDLFRLIKIAGDLDASLRWNSQPRFRLEIGLLQMIRLDSSVQIEGLLQGLEELKKNVGSEPASVRDFKVAGMVHASQPTFVQQQRTEVHEPDHAKTKRQQFGFTAMHETSPQSTENRHSLQSLTQPLAPVPDGGFEDKWKSLVRMVSEKRVAVGTMLEKTQPTGLDNGVLQVACPDDMHLTMLKRNKEFLVDLTQQVYGAKVRLEAILVPEHLHVPVKEHHIITALKRELGAEPID